MNGTCMKSAGLGLVDCDTCNFVDEKMSFLREETKARGFKTMDGVHMGSLRDTQGARQHHRPRRVAVCLPGFTGEATLCRPAHTRREDSGG